MIPVLGRGGWAVSAPGNANFLIETTVTKNVYANQCQVLLTMADI
jgi:hypothetical protein